MRKHPSELTDQGLHSALYAARNPGPRIAVQGGKRLAALLSEMYHREAVTGFTLSQRNNKTRGCTKAWEDREAEHE